MSSIPDEEPAPSSLQRYEAGDVVGGKYELLEKAGEGAMGAVWVAMNTLLEVKVAIKLIHPDLRLPIIAERLLREARSTAKIAHPSIVRVFDLGETPRGSPYIVMELLEGESLRDLIFRDGAIPAERAVALLLPIVAGMQAAHERGIIHRDLKPDNVMLTKMDRGTIQPKVVDFGIAKVQWTERGGPSTGTLMIGTPEYMAPEQANGEPVDARADIWSFCALLYEALAGDTPFTGDTPWAVLSKSVKAHAPSLSAQAGVDRELSAIVDRGLRKSPAQRWPTMKALGDALARWLWVRGVLEDASGASLRAHWAVGDLEAPAADAGEPEILDLTVLDDESAPDAVTRVARLPARRGRRTQSRRLTMGAMALAAASAACLVSIGLGAAQRARAGAGAPEVAVMEVPQMQFAIATPVASIAPPDAPREIALPDPTDAPSAQPAPPVARPAPAPRRLPPAPVSRPLEDPFDVWPAQLGDAGAPRPQDAGTSRSDGGSPFARGGIFDYEDR